MIELVDKEIKTVIIIFHMFKKMEERLSRLNRDTDDMEKPPM